MCRAQSVVERICADAQCSPQCMLGDGIGDELLFLKEEGAQMPSSVFCVSDSIGVVLRKRKVASCV